MDLPQIKKKKILLAKLYHKSRPALSNNKNIHRDGCQPLSNEEQDTNHSSSGNEYQHSAPALQLLYV